ncbi:MAG: ABC transporter ATP-binding protein [Syntrophomonadaceae bacterium]
MILEALNISKSYGAIEACSDICLSVEEGQVFGLLGPNGAGKTTLVKIFLGLVFPDSGEAYLNGQIAGSSKARQKTGYLPEQFPLYEWLTGLDFLRFNARLYEVGARKEAGAITRALEMVGLKGREKDKIRGYSKGMQQRLALAAAIVHSPPLVFLDEPTSALDPVGRRDVRDLINRLQESGATLFLNSHLLSEVEMTCTRVGFIKHGRLVACGDIREFMHPGHDINLEVEGLNPEILRELEQREKLVSFENSRLVLRVEDRQEIPVLIDYLVRHGSRVFSVQGESRKLEDVFLKLMQE